MVMRVLAIGSPHGDDRVGCELLDRLRQQLPAGVEAETLAEPLALLEHLDGCSRLVVVDACRTGATPGTVIRLAWPDCGLSQDAGASTHGFGVAAALGLAQALGKLPPRVVLIGVEVEACGPGATLSPAVRAALPELCRRVLEEIDDNAGGGRP
jgi:hydrogenase maturation protease